MCRAKRQSTTSETTSSDPAHPPDCDATAKAHVPATGFRKLLPLAALTKLFCHRWYQAPVMSRAGVIAYRVPNQAVCSTLVELKAALLTAAATYPPWTFAPMNSGLFGLLEWMFSYPPKNFHGPTVYLAPTWNTVLSETVRLTKPFPGAIVLTAAAS